MGTLVGKRLVDANPSKPLPDDDRNLEKRSPPSYTFTLHQGRKRLLICLTSKSIRSFLPLVTLSQLTVLPLIPFLKQSSVSSALKIWIQIQEEAMIPPGSAGVLQGHQLPSTANTSCEGKQHHLHHPEATPLHVLKSQPSFYSSTSERGKKELISTLKNR